MWPIFFFIEFINFCNASCKIEKCKQETWKRKNMSLCKEIFYSAQITKPQLFARKFCLLVITYTCWKVALKLSDVYYLKHVGVGPNVSHVQHVTWLYFACIYALKILFCPSTVLFSRGVGERIKSHFFNGYGSCNYLFLNIMWLNDA